jgi:hypothetical protein
VKLLELEKDYIEKNLTKEEKFLINKIKVTIKDLEFMDKAFNQQEEWQQESFDNKVKVLYRQLPEN